MTPKTPAAEPPTKEQCMAAFVEVLAGYYAQLTEPELVAAIARSDAR
jgi:hypothetical protein